MGVCYGGILDKMTNLDKALWANIVDSDRDRYACRRHSVSDRVVIVFVLGFVLGFSVGTAALLAI
jgi:hypothetical protein